VVLIGERSGMGLVDHIGIDDIAAAAEATTHLLSQGRRRVAFIGADPADSLRMAELRLQGYRQALVAAGHEVDDSLVFRTRSYHRRDGEEVMSALLDLDPRPDGVFCATDLVALGALRAAHRRGARVPEDVALVGFDGLEEGEYSVPTLSTVAPDKQEIARVAVDTLLARIAARASSQDEPAPRDLVVPFSLVIRESSRAS
jgi:DNA-binding LacI/PurR family transcriptional regulator